MSKYFQREQQQLAFTFSIVLLLGGITFKSFMEEESAPTYLASTESVRSPASIPQIDSGALVNSMKTKTDVELSLNCKKPKLEKLKFNSEFIQISGSSCLELADGQQVELVNLANGYTASMFFYAAQKYQTDIIPLKRGTNKIVVKAPLKGGKIYEYSFEIEASGR